MLMPTYCAGVQTWPTKLARQSLRCWGAAEGQGNQGAEREQAAQGRPEAQAERLQGTHP